MKITLKLQLKWRGTVEHVRNYARSYRFFDDGLGVIGSGAIRFTCALSQSAGARLHLTLKLVLRLT